MKIAILGAYSTPFGELRDKGISDLIIESGRGALRDAHLAPAAVESIFVGNMCAGLFCGQMHLGAMAADLLAVNCAATMVEGACASGSFALRSGIAAIQSGMAEVVMVIIMPMMLMAVSTMMLVVMMLVAVSTTMLSMLSHNCTPIRE